MATLQSYFRKYLSNIEPTSANVDDASTHHQELRRKLDADEGFSDWYQGSFLYGSYARHTATSPIKDVDVCILLDIDPYSGDAAYAPEKVISTLRRVLNRNGYKEKTDYQRRSVRVDLSDMHLDVVPAVAPNGKDNPLLIPDRELKQWVDSDPLGHMTASTQINKDTGGRYKPFVKIVKAWFRYQMHELQGIERPKPKGFTLEAMVAAYGDRDAPSYAEAFVNFLQNIDSQFGNLLAAGVFPLVPDPAMEGKHLKLNIEPDEAKAFGELVKTTLVQAQYAYSTEGTAESVRWWREIFGNDFPSVDIMRVAEATFSTATKSLPTEYREIYGTRVAGHAVVAPSTTLSTLRLIAETGNWEKRLVTGVYPSDGDPLPKGTELRFRIEKCSVSRPYEVIWIVQNHGADARDAGILEFSENTGQTEEFWRHTAYRGSHTLICQLKKNGALVAQAEYVVNVGRDWLPGTSAETVMRSYRPNTSEF